MNTTTRTAIARNIWKENDMNTDWMGLPCPKSGGTEEGIDREDGLLGGTGPHYKGWGGIVPRPWKPVLIKEKQI